MRERWVTRPCCLSVCILPSSHGCQLWYLVAPGQCNKKSVGVEHDEIPWRLKALVCPVVAPLQVVPCLIEWKTKR